MLKGIEFAEIRDVIARAFSADEFDMLLYEKLDFDRPLVVADGPFKLVVTNVLKHFGNAGTDPFLIAAVAAARPMKAEVQEMYRKYAKALIGQALQDNVDTEVKAALTQFGLAPKVDLQTAGKALLPTPAAATNEAFERQVKKYLDQLDPRQWGYQLFKNEARVCLIRVNGHPLGTGFLVGPETVLTNHHVVQEAIQAKWAGSKISCLFDFRVGRDGQLEEGTPVSLAATFDQWHVDSSPGLPEAEELSGTPEASIDQLDHAVLRLDRAFGSESVGPGGPIRGWIRIPAVAPMFPEHSPILILQHPKSGPVRLAMDTDAVLSSAPARVRYTTNTESGSSGSPCFNMNWGAVALHHLGDTSKITVFNQGVPLHLIRDRLVRLTRDSLLGGESP